MTDSYSKTRVLRATITASILLAWLSSLVALIIGVYLIVSSPSSSIDGEAHTMVFSTSFNITIPAIIQGTTLMTPIQQQQHLIAKMGAIVGLIGTGMLFPAFVWSVKKSSKISATACSGTAFARWLGGVGLFFSIGFCVTAAVLVHIRHYYVRGLTLGVTICCFSETAFLFIASFVVLFKPSKRRDSQNVHFDDSDSSSYGRDEDEKESCKWTPGSPVPYLDIPIGRCHSVRRKRVDYFSYLFDNLSREQMQERHQWKLQQQENRSREDEGSDVTHLNYWPTISKTIPSKKEAIHRRSESDLKERQGVLHGILVDRSSSVLPRRPPVAKKAVIANAGRRSIG